MKIIDSHSVRQRKGIFDTLVGYLKVIQHPDTNTIRR